MTEEGGGNVQVVSTGMEAKLRLETKHKSGSGWFFWIAVLSLINSGVMLAGGEWNFVVGLGMTQVVDAIAMGIVQEGGALGQVAHAVALMTNIVIAIVFIVFGVLSRKGFLWSYVVGMIIYALDGLLFLLVKDMLSLGFHAFALFCIWGGLSAARQLRQFDAAKTETETSAVPPPVLPEA